MPARASAKVSGEMAISGKVAVRSSPGSSSCHQMVRHPNVEMTVGHPEDLGVAIHVRVAAGRLANEDRLGNVPEAVGKVLRRGKGVRADEDEEVAAVVKARARDGDEKRTKVRVVPATVVAKVDDEAIVGVRGDELLKTGGELVHGLARRWVDGVELQIEYVRGGHLGEGNVLRPRVGQGLLAACGDGMWPVLRHEGMEFTSIDNRLERDGGGVTVFAEGISRFARRVARGQDR